MDTSPDGKQVYGYEGVTHSTCRDKTLTSPHMKSLEDDEQFGVSKFDQRDVTFPTHTLNPCHSMSHRQNVEKVTPKPLSSDAFRKRINPNMALMNEQDASRTALATKSFSNQKPAVYDGSGSLAVDHKSDVGNAMRDYIIDKLVQEARDFLGFNPSDSSETTSSPKSSSSDSDVEENTQWSFAVQYSAPMPPWWPFGDPDDANTVSQTQSQAQDARDGTWASASIRQSRFDSSGRRKRARDDDEPGEEDDERDKRRKRGDEHDGNGRRLRRFACPFYKKNPEIHGRNASCLWPGFSTISRLKEHLYRVHVSNVDGENICPRCRTMFETSPALVRHLARANRCTEVVVPQQEDGLDDDQVIAIRRRDRGGNPEAKWRDIYRICHHLPEYAETPWPYCDQDSPTSQAVEGYDRYQRENMPDLIRQRLERQPNIQHMIEDFRERLPEIIRDCQDELYRRFTSHQANVEPTQEHASRADDAVSAANHETERTEGTVPHQHPVGPPEAFEAPPNTDHGMTVSEAQQVRALSGQQSDRNADSGYGSHEHNSHQPEQASEGDTPVLSSAPSKPPPVESPAHGSSSSHSIHPLPNANANEPTQRPGLSHSEEADDHWMPNQPQRDPYPGAAEQSLIPQTNNLEGWPSDGFWLSNVDWNDYTWDIGLDGQWPERNQNPHGSGIGNSFDEGVS